MPEDLKVPDNDTESGSPDGRSGGGVFATTRWSMVMGAGEDSDAGYQALVDLCRIYWFPVFVLVRARGVGAEDAKDLTQEFFLKLIDRRMVGRVRRERGRFRHFLGAAVKNFLSDQWDKSQTVKRGGGVTFVPLEGEEAERVWNGVPQGRSPETEFDRNWALEIFAEAGRRFERQAESAGQGEIIRILKRSGDPLAPSMAEEAARLGMGINTLKSLLHRARARHARMIREVVAETVSTPDEVEGELRELLAIVSGE